MSVSVEEDLIFKNIDLNSVNDFMSFQTANCCSDTAYGMLLSWSNRFEYKYCICDDVIIVTGSGIEREREFFIIKNSLSSVIKAVSLIIEYCKSNDMECIFNYISEGDIEEFRYAVERTGHKINFEYNDDYSDYIYKTHEFISMTGSKSKTKRGGYNYISGHYPELRYKEYSPELYSDCIAVFDKWCDSHDCSRCFYGCEKMAFRRFMEHYNKDIHMIGLAYDGDKPLSFALCQKINSNTMCYFFQKNSERIRGLTYWLNRQMALMHTDVEYINLGEDMGIAGLRTDKTQLRPCFLKRKYIGYVI